jgi:hypothetical protein
MSSPEPDTKTEGIKNSEKQSAEGQVKRADGDFFRCAGRTIDARVAVAHSDDANIGAGGVWRANYRQNSTSLIYIKASIQGPR